MARECIIIIIADYRLRVRDRMLKYYYIVTATRASIVLNRKL